MKRVLKTLWEKEKMLFSFSNNVFYSTRQEINTSAKFVLSSANAFNLEQSKILLFGKELTLYYIDTQMYKQQIDV